MKNILVLALFLLFGKTAGANILLSGFSLNGASSGSKFMINNLHAPTDIEFKFTLLKYTDQYTPGDCYVTLLYTESPENNNYNSHPSTIEISPTKYVRKSEYINGAIYQSAWLSAVLPAYKFSGKIVLRYRFFNSAQKKEVSLYSTVKYDLTIPPSNISNDDYTGAIELSSVAIAGSTKDATQSPQDAPACAGGIDDDIWYKFVATSNLQTVKLSNIVYDGYGGTSASMAIYSASLNQIECVDREDNITSNELIIGNTYYVRVWTTELGKIKNMSFNIRVVTPSSQNVVKRILFYWDTKVVSAQFIHDPIIPISDIVFEWELVEAEYFSYEPGVFDISNSTSSTAVLYSYETDYYTNVRVRMKQISTGTYISDWCVTSSPIFSWRNRWKTLSNK